MTTRRFVAHRELVSDKVLAGNYEPFFPPVPAGGVARPSEP
jgi:hypothetical protein